MVVLAARDKAESRRRTIQVFSVLGHLEDLGQSEDEPRIVIIVTIRVLRSGQRIEARLTIVIHPVNLDGIRVVTRLGQIFLRLYHRGGGQRGQLDAHPPHERRMRRNAVFVRRLFGVETECRQPEVLVDRCEGFGSPLLVGRGVGAASG